MDFEKEIQPIFAAKCLWCHGAAKQKGGYRLDVQESALRGGEAHTPNIVPGSSAKTVDKTDWWSLKPVVKAAPSGAGHPIDAFIAARLAGKGLQMAPQANARTLGRRLYFDLTGLPPTPADLDAFAADKAPDAYEKLVDKLLASPRYGECWARHWLDVVHYGETHGYDKDQPRANSWP